MVVCHAPGVGIVHAGRVLRAYDRTAAATRPGHSLLVNAAQARRARPVMTRLARLLRVHTQAPRSGLTGSVRTVRSRWPGAWRGSTTGGGSCSRSRSAAARGTSTTSYRPRRGLLRQRQAPPHCSGLGGQRGLHGQRAPWAAFRRAGRGPTRRRSTPSGPRADDPGYWRHRHHGATKGLTIKGAAPAWRGRRHHEVGSAPPAGEAARAAHSRRGRRDLRRRQAVDDLVAIAVDLCA